MEQKPLTTLQVVGVRYLDARQALANEVPLDAYLKAAVYWDVGLPVIYAEPLLSAARYSGVVVDDLGLVCAAIAEQVAQGRRAGYPVLVSGGNCSHSVGILAGLQQAHGPAARIGIVWLDAHGDFNTPNTTRSGMLAGMPLAVCAGLGQPRWRELAGVLAPLPTERIILVDGRNLDPEEEQLIRATAMTVAAATPGRPGADLATAVAALATQCDTIYLHVDSDILDATLTPNYFTREPNGISMAEAVAVMESVLATGKVAVLAVMSVFGDGEGAEQGVAAGVELIRAGLSAWRRFGQP